MASSARTQLSIDLTSGRPFRQHPAEHDAPAEVSLLQSVRFYFDAGRSPDSPLPERSAALREKVRFNLDPPLDVAGGTLQRTPTTCGSGQAEANTGLSRDLAIPTIGKEFEAQLWLCRNRDA